MSKYSAESNKRAAPSENGPPPRKVKSAFTATIEAKLGRPSAYDEDLTQPRPTTRYQQNVAKSRPVKPLLKRTPSTYIHTMTTSRPTHEFTFLAPAPRKFVKPVIDIALGHIKSNNARTATKSQLSSHPPIFASRVPTATPINYYHDAYMVQQETELNEQDEDFYTTRAADNPVYNDDDDASTLKLDVSASNIPKDAASINYDYIASPKNDNEKPTAYYSKIQDNDHADVIMPRATLLPKPFSPYQPGSCIPAFEQPAPFEFRNPAGLKHSSLILLSAQINEHAARSSAFMTARAANAELFEKVTKHKNEIADLLADVRKAGQLDVVGLLECKMVEANEQWARAAEKRSLLEGIAADLLALEEKIFDLDWLVAGVEGKLKELS